MTIELETGVRVGDCTIAVLVRRSAWSHCGRRRLSAWIDKRPVAILIVQGAGVRAFDLQGNPLPLDEVERLCPGAAAAAERRAQ